MPQSIEIKRETNSPVDRSMTTSLSIKHDYPNDDDEEINVDDYDHNVRSSSLLDVDDVKYRREIYSTMTSTSPDTVDTSPNNDVADQTRQIRYYHDRVDFRGDILLKPAGAKSMNIIIVREHCLTCA
jgi:hypothetical protein